jgi:Zn-dependent protease with chaperone function
MHRICSLLLPAFLAALGLGCAAAPQNAGLWIADHGGLLASPDLRQARVESVSAKLVGACTGRKITVQVLATNAVTAFSLRDGHIFVTKGLMDHLDDTELQAAVAHELGHLLSDGHVQTVASLRGCCVDPDREVRADAVGVELLRAQGLSPIVMTTMLKKVEIYGSLPPQCLIAIDHRITAISARIESDQQSQLLRSTDSRSSP